MATIDESEITTEGELDLAEVVPSGDDANLDDEGVAKADPVL